MPFYTYKARNQAGLVETGKVEAVTSNNAANVLRERGLFIISIKEIKKSIFSSFGQGVKFEEVVIFTRQFSTMIEAGLSLTQALHLLASQNKPGFATIINQIVVEVEGGSTLTDALAKHPKVFNNTYIQLIKAGEASGALDEVLSRLADNMEEENELKGKIIGAMIYPAVVVLVMVIVFIIMMVVVIPQLTSVFAELGAELPLPTKILMGVSDFMQKFWWTIPGFLAVFYFIFLWWHKPRKNQLLFDQFLFKLPIFGELRKKTILTEFTRTMSLLLRTGIPLVSALEICTKSVTSILYRDALGDTKEKVEKGISMGKAIGIYQEFPPLISQMILVGEETGKLDDVLARVSKYYKAETERAVAGSMAAIEPLIMIVLGIGVAFLVFAIILPINNLSQQI